MPDPGKGQVHRFRDHVVAGVNWRPTRFVDEVPSSRVCGLCRMIPRGTVLLPCGHALCQSCHAASLEGGVGRCALDQVQFNEAECFTYEFPTRIANALKVYCWNKEHGCEYTSTMDSMLEHYENECTFHAVECLRCGEGVQHRDLPTHYAARCTARVSAAITESSKRSALTLADVNDALEDVKAMLGCLNHDQVLPVIQSQLNELTEQVKSQDTKFAGITREIGASELNLKGDIAQIAATISATVSRQLTSLPNSEGEASTSSSLSLRSEMALILRKLEHLVDVEHWRQTFPKPDSSSVFADCSIYCYPHLRLHGELSTTNPSFQKIYEVQCNLFLKNCEEIIQYQGGRRKFAEIWVRHMRDTYFTVAVFKCKDIPSPSLAVEIEFNGMLVDSRCWPPFWRVSVWDSAIQDHRFLTSRPVRCLCKRQDNSLLHFHLESCIGTACLKKDDFFRDGEIWFQIWLDDTDMNGGVEGQP